jgi:hypothetical protein
MFGLERKLKSDLLVEYENLLSKAEARRLDSGEL